MVSGTIRYAKQDRTYVLKFVGELRYTQAPSLDAFLDGLFQRRDVDNILIDLVEAESIDSTILGLLAKIANFMRSRFGRKSIIVSTNPDINQVLDSVGFFDVFNVCSDLELAAEASRLPDSDASQRQMAETILEAHDILSQLNEKNRVMFRDVVEALKDELGKQTK